jgi:4-diphosphocytidyl-2-C-methyl-D-erythritol kinase
MDKTQARVCTIDAPCKINLHLSVGEKRPDGFHDLESIFVSLALGDNLRFECTDKKGDCHLFIDWILPQQEYPAEQIPLKKNLVFKAVSLFREQSGFKKGLNIRLIKRIPMGAGLGGGSSDAASALLAMNSLADEALPMEKLMEMAAVLGSDVPFFLTGGAAYVCGRGELVKPVKIPDGLWVVLAKPHFSSDTSTAFRLLDLARNKDKNTKEKFSSEALILALQDDPETWPFYNDFFPVFLDSKVKGRMDPKMLIKASFYQFTLESLRRAGASFTGLSGSGSCCFGIFRLKEAAEKAEMILRQTKNFVNLTFFLAQKAKPVLEC